jgi:hypothetical protein
MTFDSHLDRLREKLFKKKPTTVMEVYDKRMLFSCLDKHYGKKRTIGEYFNYLKEKVQIAMMSSENRHGFVMTILEKVGRPHPNARSWLTGHRNTCPTSIHGTFRRIPASPSGGIMIILVLTINYTETFCT